MSYNQARRRYAYTQETRGRKTAEYRAWLNMKSRCLNPNAAGYNRYGGRGIKVHEGWVSDFQSFLSHVGTRPSAGHSLDRIDNDKGYEPGNVRWATKVTQVYNSSTVIPIGPYASISEAARVTGIKVNTLIYRLRREWDQDRALKP